MEEVLDQGYNKTTLKDQGKGIFETHYNLLSTEGIRIQ